MMRASESTNLPFLRGDYKQEFADSMGTRTYGRAEELYHELVTRADDKGNPAITKCLRSKLFPAMAHYRVLLAEGVPQSDALTAVRHEIQKAVLAKKESSAQMARIPFALLPCHMDVKSHMSRNFLAKG